MTTATQPRTHADPSATAAGLLSLGDGIAAPSDAVTFDRREVKFTFRSGDARKLRELLERRCDPVRFGAARESRVYSLYFDDDRLSACEESLAGLHKRVKLRLRWYDEPAATARAWFEVKRREGVMVRKERTPVRLHRPLTDIPLHDLVRSLIESLPDKPSALLALRSRPSVCVAYHRQHFRDPTTGMRLTLDDRIRGVDQTGLRRFTSVFPVALDDLVVVEAKIRSGDESAVAHLLSPLRVRPIRSSKYLSCCARMGWTTFADRHE